MGECLPKHPVEESAALRRLARPLIWVAAIISEATLVCLIGQESIPYHFGWILVGPPMACTALLGGLRRAD